MPVKSPASRICAAVAPVPAADIGLADTDADRLIELRHEATDADGWRTLGAAEAGAGDAGGSMRFDSPEQLVGWLAGGESAVMDPGDHLIMVTDEGRADILVEELTGSVISMGLVPSAGCNARPTEVRRGHSAKYR